MPIASFIFIVIAVVVGIFILGGCLAKKFNC